MIYDLIDNALSDEMHKEIYDTMYSDIFPWHFVPDITHKNKYIDNLFYMTHNFYSMNRPQSIFFDQWFSYFENVLGCEQMIRMKGNLYPSQKQLSKHPQHIDLPQIKSTAAIYYINDNDGATIINKKRIKSVANRLVIFDGHTKHSSTDCTDTQARMNINFNYIK